MWLILLEQVLKFPNQLDLRIVFSRMKQSVYSRPTDAHQWHMAEGSFYRVPEHDRFIAQTACIRRGIL